MSEISQGSGRWSPPESALKPYDPEASHAELVQAFGEMLEDATTFAATMAERRAKYEEASYVIERKAPSKSRFGFVRQKHLSEVIRHPVWIVRTGTDYMGRKLDHDSESSDYTSTGRDLGMDPGGFTTVIRHESRGCVAVDGCGVIYLLKKTKKTTNGVSELPLPIEYQNYPIDVNSDQARVDTIFKPSTTARQVADVLQLWRSDLNRTIELSGAEPSESVERYPVAPTVAH